MAIRRIKKSNGFNVMSRFGIISVAALLFLGFSGYYFWNLYQQVELQFNKAEQSLPTRVYSDVFKVFAGLPKSHFDEKIKSLNYSTKWIQDEMQFELRSLEYPAYLLPENHAQTENQKNKKIVRVKFHQNDKSYTVSEVFLNDQPITDIFLEPELIATLAKNTKSIRDNVAFHEFPSKIWEAIISIEDQHFLEHSGFDPKGLLRAVWINIKTMSFAQGGSTLTQQLVKNLTERRGKNLFRKVHELLLSLYLEVRYSKEQILERYLNEVYLGQAGGFEVHGVAEGARLFFGKNINNLNLAEMALLAGLIRGPGFYSPYTHKDRAIDRMKLVLKKMVETGHLAEEEAKMAAQMPLRLVSPQTATNRAPYFIDLIKTTLFQKLSERFTEEEIISSGFKVYSTLDVRLNQIAQKNVTDKITDLEKTLKKKKIKKSNPTETKDRLEGILVSLDPKTGYIKSLIGGRSYSESNYNRVLNMKRQVGSTLKPLVYLKALEKGTSPSGVPYSPAFPIEDSPLTISYDSGRQSWSPKNYDPEYLGWISLRTALAHSVNTAAARLAMQVGLDSIIELANRMGVASKLIAVPSLALGSIEMTVFELLNVYLTFANQGEHDELTVIRAVTLNDGTSLIRHVYQPKTVVNPALIDLTTDMMTSVFTDGTATAMSKAYKWTRPSAGKTGTTSDYRDSWFIGYTPELLTLTWVGTDEDTSPYILTGASAALPVWIQFMKEALNGLEEVPFDHQGRLTDFDYDLHSGWGAHSDCLGKKQDKAITDSLPQNRSCEADFPQSESEVHAP